MARPFEKKRKKPYATKKEYITPSGEVEERQFRPSRPLKSFSLKMASPHQMPKRGGEEKWGLRVNGKTLHKGEKKKEEED